MKVVSPRLHTPAWRHLRPAALSVHVQFSNAPFVATLRSVRPPRPRPEGARSPDRSGKSRAALSLLTEAGADVRLINIYPIHHDKVLIVDGETVELGSFNYSDAAAHRNSENVLVNWRNPQLAKVYLEHFTRNYRQATPYQLQY